MGVYLNNTVSTCCMFMCVYVCVCARLDEYMSSRITARVRLCCLPMHQEGDHARPGGTLKQAEEDSQNVHLVCLRGHDHQTGDQPPCYLETAEPVARPNVREDDLAGDQHQAVGNVEVGGEVVELISVKP